MRMSYFKLLAPLELGDNSAPSDTSGKEEVKPSYAFPIWLPHFRQRSLVLRRNKPHECLWKWGTHCISSTWVNLLSSILKNEMIPRFMDFPYFDPMDVVFRFEEDRFSSYPQEPQLQKIDKDKVLQWQPKENKNCSTTWTNHNQNNRLSLQFIDIDK